MKGFKNLFRIQEEDKDKYSSKAVLDTDQKINEAYRENAPLLTGLYPLLDNLYNDRHWDIQVDGIDNTRFENYSQFENNFCSDTVDRWTGFVGASPPSFSVLKASEYNIAGDVGAVETEVSVEEDEAESIQKILWNFLRENHFRTLFMELVHLQSRYGRVMPFVFLNKEISHYPIVQLLPPYDCFPVFKSGSNREILYMVFREAVDTKILEEKYKKKFSADSGIDDSHGMLDYKEEMAVGQRDRTYVWYVITKEEWRTYIDKKLVDVKKINYGKPPFFLAKNKVTPFSAAGESDMYKILKNQLAHNKTYSNIIDAIEDAATGKRLIKNASASTDLNAIADRRQRHVPLGRDVEIQDLPSQLPLNESMAVLKEIEQKIEDKTGITELLKGRFSGSIATGVALSGLSKGIQDLALIKIQNLSELMEEVFNFVLQLLKKYRKEDPNSKIPYSKIIKRDKYFFNFIWDNTSIQDERLKATTNIDLVNSKLKSRMTAMKDMKTQYPEDELSRVTWETLNPLMNPELTMQIAAQNMQEGVNEEAETFNAKSENAKILRGVTPTVNETKEEQHSIHEEIHQEIEKLARGKAQKALDEHKKMHKQKRQEAKKQAGQAKAGGGAPGMQPGQQKSPGGIVPGMGNENVRPKAMPGQGNPQAKADSPII